VDPQKPLLNKVPDFLSPVISKMVSIGVAPEPDQITVNQYSPGQG